MTKLYTGAIVENTGADQKPLTGDTVVQETVLINTDRKKSVISRHIYGHFAEHLGRCIYGGFWVGKNSPIENIDGYRKDVVEAFKEIKIPNLRWPGGCFADEYHWKDGIGPKENRKRMVNTHWGGVVEDNSFGTHEFMGLCEVLDCKPYICGNVGSGTVQEMSEWVEYITFEGESPMANLRAQNGHDKAWKLDFFGVGNENWGCGGNMRAEYYADLYRRYQTYVRQYGKDRIYKIAGGPNAGDYHWSEVLMREAARFMDGMSLHYYTVGGTWEQKSQALVFDDAMYYETVRKAYYMEELVRRHDEIMTKYDPDKRIGLVVDEWGCWHSVEPGTNPGFLYQQNTMRDAVVAGVTLNVFNNHSDRVQVANLAQAVNVLQSPVLTEGDRIVLTPTWHVLNMFKAHQDATLLETSCAASVCGNEKDTMPGMSVSASEKEGTYTVTMSNNDLSASKDIRLVAAGLKGKICDIKAQVLAGGEINACNTFDKPDTVTAKTLSAQSEDGSTITFTLPPESVACVSFCAR